MKIMTSCRLAGLALLLACGSAAAKNTNHATVAGDPGRNVLPVLVSVDNVGKVTNISTPEKLRPGIQRLLSKSIDQLVTGPAYDHKGRPRASNALFNLGIKSSKRGDGKLDLSLVYLSAVPIPQGKWRWVYHNHRYGLVNVNEVSSGMRIYTGAWNDQLVNMIAARSARVRQMQGGH